MPAQDALELLAPLPQRIEAISAAIADSTAREIFLNTVQRVDAAQHAALQSKWRSELERYHPKGMFKYFDICFWIREKIVRARRLGLDNGAPRSILDLGCGGGHFSAVCNALGHRTAGIDVDVPFYADLAALLKVERRVEAVLPGRAINVADKVDMVTAFGVSFNSLGVDQQRRRRYWGVAEWDFLVRQLSTDVVRYPGVIYFELNRAKRPDGSMEPHHAVFEAARAAGAEVAPETGRILFKVAGPLGLRAKNLNKSGPFT